MAPVLLLCMIVRPQIQAFAVALARMSLAGMLLLASTCGGGGDAKKSRVTMRMRPDCQFLVMPEECMEAVVVEDKPKGVATKWF